MTTKMIAVDMDGTFLSDEKTYNVHRFELLYNEMKKQQIKFVVASGNQYHQLKTFFPTIHQELSFVAENGAYVVKENEDMFVGQMSKDMMLRTIATIESIEGAHLLICGKNSAYISTREAKKFYEVAKNYYYELTWVENYQEIDDTIFKFALMFPENREQQALIELKTALQGELLPVSSGHGAIDLILPGIHKANGLEILQKEWRIRDSEIVAFGDSGNDMEMLQHAGTGFAMKNGRTDVIEVSDFVTTNDNNQEGVLVEIEKLLARSKI